MPNGKPNILILWGDDIGQSNLSCYSHGLMGYETPNIDRVAKEGAKFIHYYAEQSCTAGRAAFITGQSVFRTGLSKVGLPGAEQGFRAEDPTIAELLQPMGYRTGQFGKNHFGDRDEHLPTMHGFDEFFGNLYHLNAEEEPELRDYPKQDDPEFPNFRKRFAPRGVLHCWANGDGTQRIESTGPLTRKRMETADDEFLTEAKRFIRDAVASGEPFFVWFNTTHMHFRTYARPQDVGRSGRWQSLYHDVMIYHDECIGEMLNLLDELGISDDTIVMYGTDNGPHMNSWPDAGMTPLPQREEHQLGRGLPRAGPRALARPHPGRDQHHWPLQPSRLAADSAGRRRRTGDQAEASRWLFGGRENLPDPSRWLQHARLLDGQDRQESTPGILLLLGRRRSGGPPLRQLEVRVP
jgi:arylsulfatase A-like enzyme